MMERDFRREIAKATRTSDVDALASIAMELLAECEVMLKRRERDRLRKRSADSAESVEVGNGNVERGSPPDSPSLPPTTPNLTPLTPHSPQQQPRARARGFDAVTALAKRLPDRVTGIVEQLAGGQRNPTAWAMSMAGMLDGLGVKAGKSVTPEQLAQALAEIAATNREPTPLSVRRFLEQADKQTAPDRESEGDKFLRGVA